MGFDKQRAVQESVAAASDEISQLRQMVAALRTEMENQRARYFEESQSVRVATRDELHHLEQMIVALREQMEKTHAR